MTDQTATNDRVFAGKLAAAVDAANSLVCVGLDPQLDRLPAHLRTLPPREAIVRFNAAIVEATRDLVCAYKPNLGFYVAHGLDGLAALVATREVIPSSIPVILDAKTGDIDSTAAAYARGFFEEWGFDGVTLNPYLGEDSLQPFLTRADKGVFVLCKTSNPGSGDVQNLAVRADGAEHPLYLSIADRVAVWSARYPATVGLVVGATYPVELAEVRRRCPGQPILLPGVGAQAGDLAAAIAAGADADGRGLLVSASRSITYAGGGKEFAERARAAALELREAVNEARAGLSSNESRRRAAGRPGLKPPG